MIDVVIATYNRFDNAQRLALDLINATKIINNVIIVDSTKDVGPLKITLPKIKLVTTSHPNQPYQRYLGYMVANKSKSPFILFLDDDMQMLNNKIFEDFLALFKHTRIVGINLPFVNHNSFLDNQPKGIIKSEGVLKKIISSISGYPLAEMNKYIHNGIRGPRVGNLNIEYLSGGAFMARKSALYKNFNMQLFSIYEGKKGKGEDGILGYTLSKQGEIYAYSEECFIHNDFNDSTYSNTQQAFSARVLFSRLYLSCEYYRLNNKPISLAYLRFYHYAIGRLAGGLINFLIRPSKTKLETLLGNYQGFIKSFRFKFHSGMQSNFYWEEEAKAEYNLHLIK